MGLFLDCMILFCGDTSAKLPGSSSLSLNSKYAKIINSSILSNTDF